MTRRGGRVGRSGGSTCWTKPPARVERQIADPAALPAVELGALNTILARITAGREARAAYAQHLFALRWWPQRDDRRAR